jgi:DNA-binding PadR family transcriptional regulator
MKISKELLKGSTATMILKVISEGDSYGYEITQKIAARSKEVFKLNEGTLYPILHTMVKEKWITSYEKESATGRMRKYYTITPLGTARLALLLEEWHLFTASVEGVLSEG